METTKADTEKQQQPQRLRGRNARQEGRRKLRLVLSFIASAGGYSTADIINELIGRVDRSYAWRLERRGYLSKVQADTFAAGALYLLTKKAAFEARLALETELKLPRRAEDIPLKMVAHDLAVQRACAPSVAAGISVVFDRFLPRMPDNKAPDALLLHQNGTRRAVEIELTPKDGRALEAALWRHQIAMNEGRWQNVTYIAASMKLIQCYRTRLKLPFTFSAWGPDGKWYTQYSLFPDEQARFQFQRRPDLLIDTLGRYLGDDE